MKVGHRLHVAASPALLRLGAVSFGRPKSTSNRRVDDNPDEQSTWNRNERVTALRDAEVPPPSLLLLGAPPPLTETFPFSMAKSASTPTSSIVDRYFTITGTEANAPSKTGSDWLSYNAHKLLVSEGGVQSSLQSGNGLELLAGRGLPNNNITNNTIFLVPEAGLSKTFLIDSERGSAPTVISAASEVEKLTKSDFYLRRQSLLTALYQSQSAQPSQLSKGMSLVDNFVKVGAWREALETLLALSGSVSTEMEKISSNQQIFFMFGAQLILSRLNFGNSQQRQAGAQLVKQLTQLGIAGNDMPHSELLMYALLCSDVPYLAMHTRYFMNAFYAIYPSMLPPQNGSSTMPDARAVSLYLNINERLMTSVGQVCAMDEVTSGDGERSVDASSHRTEWLRWTLTATRRAHFRCRFSAFDESKPDPSSQSSGYVKQLHTSFLEWYRMCSCDPQRFLSLAESLASTIRSEGVSQDPFSQIFSSLLAVEKFTHAESTATERDDLLSSFLLGTSPKRKESDSVSVSYFTHLPLTAILTSLIHDPKVKRGGETTLHGKKDTGFISNSEQLEIFQIYSSLLQEIKLVLESDLHQPAVYPPTADTNTQSKLVSPIDTGSEKSELGAQKSDTLADDQSDSARSSVNKGGSLLSSTTSLHVVRSGTFKANDGPSSGAKSTNEAPSLGTAKLEDTTELFKGAQHIAEAIRQTNASTADTLLGDLWARHARHMAIKSALFVTRQRMILVSEKSMETARGKWLERRSQGQNTFQQQASDVIDTPTNYTDYLQDSDGLVEMQNQQRLSSAVMTVPSRWHSRSKTLFSSAKHNKFSWSRHLERLRMSYEKENPSNTTTSAATDTADGRPSQTIRPDQKTAHLIELFGVELGSALFYMQGITTSTIEQEQKAIHFKRMAAERVRWLLSVTMCGATVVPALEAAVRSLTAMVEVYDEREEANKRRRERKQEQAKSKLMQPEGQHRPTHDGSAIAPVVVASAAELYHTDLLNRLAGSGNAKNTPLPNPPADSPLSNLLKDSCAKPITRMKRTNRIAHLLGMRRVLLLLKRHICNEGEVTRFWHNSRNEPNVGSDGALNQLQIEPFAEAGEGRMITNASFVNEVTDDVGNTAYPTNRSSYVGRPRIPSLSATPCLHSIIYTPTATRISALLLVVNRYLARDIMRHSDSMTSEAHQLAATLVRQQKEHHHSTSRQEEDLAAKHLSDRQWKLLRQHHSMVSLLRSVLSGVADSDREAAEALREWDTVGGGSLDIKQGSPTLSSYPSSPMVPPSTSKPSVGTLAANKERVWYRVTQRRSSPHRSIVDGSTSTGADPDAGDPAGIQSTKPLKGLTIRDIRRLRRRRAEAIAKSTVASDSPKDRTILKTPQQPDQEKAGDDAIAIEKIKSLLSSIMAITEPIEAPTAASLLLEKLLGSEDTLTDAYLTSKVFRHVIGLLVAITYTKVGNGDDGEDSREMVKDTIIAVIHQQLLRQQGLPPVEAYTCVALSEAASGNKYDSLNRLVGMLAQHGSPGRRCIHFLILGLLGHTKNPEDRSGSPNGMDAPCHWEHALEAFKQLQQSHRGSHGVDGALPSSGYCTLPYTIADSSFRLFLESQPPKSESVDGLSTYRDAISLYLKLLVSMSACEGAPLLSIRAPAYLAGVICEEMRNEIIPNMAIDEKALKTQTTKQYMPICVGLLRHVIYKQEDRPEAAAKTLVLLRHIVAGTSSLKGTSPFDDLKHSMQVEALLASFTEKMVEGGENDKGVDASVESPPARHLRPPASVVGKGNEKMKKLGQYSFSDWVNVVAVSELLYIKSRAPSGASNTRPDQFGKILSLWRTTAAFGRCNPRWKDAAM